MKPAVASAQDAIGKSADMEGQRGVIVGVVEDINIYSLRRPPYPIVYALRPVARHDYLSVRFRAAAVSEALAHFRKTWQAMVPSYPLDYAFLDASFERLHLAERG